MEERAQEEKKKTTAAEAKVAKLQAKNRALNDENSHLRQILQQIQVCCSTTVRGRGTMALLEGLTGGRGTLRGIVCGDKSCQESGTVVSAVYRNARFNKYFLLCPAACVAPRSLP